MEPDLLPFAFLLLPYKIYLPQHFLRLPQNRKIHFIRRRRRLGVDLDGERALAFRLMDESGGGVDDGGRAHRQEYVAGGGRDRARDDGRVEALTEPDDAGPDEAAAMRAARGKRGERRCRIQPVPAPGLAGQRAADVPDRAVQPEEVRGQRSEVRTVDL